MLSIMLSCSESYITRGKLISIRQTSEMAGDSILKMRNFDPMACFLPCQCTAQSQQINGGKPIGYSQMYFCCCLNSEFYIIERVYSTFVRKVQNKSVLHQPLQPLQVFVHNINGVNEYGSTLCIQKGPYLSLVVQKLKKKS